LNRDEVEWDKFTHLFDKNYYPIYFKDQKVEEVEHLIQGNKTMHEYEAKFTKLSCYASHLIANDRRKAQQFMKGLQPSTSRAVAPVNHQVYSKVVTSAYNIDINHMKTQKLLEENDKRKEKNFESR